jgi:hypothetical protein
LGRRLGWNRLGIERSSLLSFKDVCTLPPDFLLVEDLDDEEPPTRRRQRLFPFKALLVLWALLEMPSCVLLCVERAVVVWCLNDMIFECDLRAAFDSAVRFVAYCFIALEWSYVT